MKLFNLILIISLLSVFGCSKLPKIDSVLPDKRTAYQKSKDMAVLEVPPDLTVTQGEYRATIPGESESTSLSEFERQRDQRVRRGNVVLGSGEFEDEQWLALQGSLAQIWPDLLQFWTGNGFTVELDDAELGVLETSWIEDEFSRSKFRIFAEPDATGVMLFLSSEREEQSEGQWLASTPDKEFEKEILRMINLHFYGDVALGASSLGTSEDLYTLDTFDEEPYTTTTTTTATSSVSNFAGPRAEILDLGQGRLYLAIPQEFTRAWRDTELVLDRAGFIVESSDVEKGTYDFYYFRPQEVEEEDEGLLSKLKFWGSDDEDEEGIPYRLSLTGVGNKTEAIVTNDAGEWLSNDDASVILGTLQDLYNQL